MTRVKVTSAELAQTFRIWLKVIAQRRASFLRDLWTRRGEEYDRDRIDAARTELARELSENLARAGWEVTRRPTDQEAALGSPIFRPKGD